MKIKIKTVFQCNKFVSTVALCLTVLMLSGCLDNNQSPKCDENIEDTQQTLSEWLKDAMVKKRCGRKRY